MRLAKHVKRRALEMNMTPMIDVVFLLLIFFMACSQISEANRDPLDLPVQKGTEDQARSALIVANINRDGALSVSGQSHTVPQFIALCTEEAERTHQGDASQLVVVVRADRNGTCRTVNQLVSALTKLGVTRVRLAVQGRA